MNAGLVAAWPDFREQIESLTIGWICEDCARAGEAVFVLSPSADDCPREDHPSWTPVVTRSAAWDAYRGLALP